MVKGLNICGYEPTRDNGVGNSEMLRHGIRLGMMAMYAFERTGCLSIVEGRAVRLEVCNKADLAAAKALAGIKMAN
jgi:hypothetical protein